MIKIFLIYFVSVYLIMLIFSCKQQDGAAADTVSVARTPVTITYISHDSLREFIDLNATSSFLQKSFVKSNLTGYVKKVNIRIGDFVKKGQALFVLKTKEAEAIGNSVNRLNPDFKFSGINTIAANNVGFIAELDHQEGDYVQDGEQLAAISDSRSFAFVMNVPYEDMPYISVGKDVDIFLPGQERLTGRISAAMPVMDSVSQTQSFAIKTNINRNIPQNLVATVRIVKVYKAAAATLPKNAVLSDETQSEFWVMKMINDTTAVKTLIKKGVESGDRIEIISPGFSVTDKILISGNYGLSDTASVIVQH